LTSDFDTLLARYDPARWVTTLAYRSKQELPFNVENVDADRPLLFDTTVYIDMLAGRLPDAILTIIGSRPIYHTAAALAEFALPIGYLDPRDSRTPSALAPILRSLRHISPTRVIAPSSRHWIEASLIGGTLARTQSFPKSERRRFLGDILVYLAGEEVGAIVLTRNTRDFDLLMQVRTGIEVLFYEQV
jgi:hypothetical protein